MWTLGINNMHDASATIVLDGEVVAAAEEERFVRKKHISGFPREAIGYCLREAGIGIGDLSGVALSWRYWVMRHRAWCALKSMASSFEGFVAKTSRGAGQMKHEWSELVRMRSLLTEHFGPGKYKMVYVDHHHCHQVSTFLPSPFERAAILTMDGAGEEATTVLSVGEGRHIREFGRVRLPHSLGHYYATLTGFLGFKIQSDEYKVMGLASYGEPRFADALRGFLHGGGEGFVLDSRVIDYHRARRGEYHPALTAALGPPRDPNEAVEQRHMDIAASAQLVLEERICALANNLHELAGTTDLCLAGGVALNCVANGKLLNTTPFKRIYAQPAAGDAGTSLGAALHLYHELSGQPRRTQTRQVYLGPSFSNDQVLAAAHDSGLRHEQLPFEALTGKIAGELAAGKLVFWFQDRMEWGPRALGNRSLLADPRRAEMKDVINVKVKQREEFRPFAPSMLREESANILEVDHPSPFMLFAFKVRPAMAARLPATTHVDGTARPQTVEKEANPRYWALIKAFQNQTGVPVLLNTSFNVQEPIVCTPQEALACFKRTQVDYLVMNDIVVSRDPTDGM